MFINMLLLLIHKNSNFSFVNYSMDYLDITLINMAKIGINILSYSMNKVILQQNNYNIKGKIKFF